MNTQQVQTVVDMNYNAGVEQTNHNQQLIAFWTHTIDIYAVLAENDHTMLPTAAMENEINQETYRNTGTNTHRSFMGAVREGYKRALELLPDGVVQAVERYAKRRVGHIDDFTLEEDFIFGSANPFSEEEEFSV